MASTTHYIIRSLQSKLSNMIWGVLLLLLAVIRKQNIALMLNVFQKLFCKREMNHKLTFLCTFAELYRPYILNTWSVQFSVLHRKYIFVHYYAQTRCKTTLCLREKKKTDIWFQRHWNFYQHFRFRSEFASIKCVYEFLKKNQKNKWTVEIIIDWKSYLGWHKQHQLLRQFKWKKPKHVLCNGLRNDRFVCAWNILSEHAYTRHHHMYSSTTCISQFCCASLQRTLFSVVCPFANLFLAVVRKVFSVRFAVEYAWISVYYKSISHHATMAEWRKKS